MLTNAVSFSHSLLKASLTPGDIAIDCTAGNGHDTLFLAQLVGENGHVYAFDIQEIAIEKTKKRLDAHQCQTQVTCICDSHANLASYIPQAEHSKIKAAIFNLGYLPGADKTKITTPESTLQALNSLLSIIQKGGVIVVVIYAGHPGGKRERDEVITFAKNLNQEQFDVLQYEFINQKNEPPFVIAIGKK